MDLKIILGTGSKRRIELFSKFSIPFKQATSDFDELSIPYTLSPKDYVVAIAQGKGAILSLKYPNIPILTADTTVYFEGNFYNKPSSIDEANEMLFSLQGKSHEVWTGLSVHFEGKVWTEHEMTRVFFHPLSKKQIASYVEVFNPLDKAGSYAIQDASGLLVKGIEGDFYNVVGFPLHKVQILLKKLGIDLWDHLR
jgi:septum formation protein